MVNPNIKISDLYKAGTPKEWVFHVYPDRWEMVNPYGVVYHSMRGELMAPAVNKMNDLGMDYRIEDHRDIIAE